MARSFLSASSESLVSTASPVADLLSHGITLTAWVKWDSEPTAATQILSIGQAASSTNFCVLGSSWQADDSPLMNLVMSGTNASAGAGTDLTPYVGEWVHLAGTGRETGGTRYAEIFLNGVSDATGNAPATGGTYAWDRIKIGVTADSTPFGYFNGTIADAAIYNDVLTDAQIASLANRVSPIVVAPSNLIFYAPLNNVSEGNEIDIVGGLTLTETGTPTYSEGPLLARGPHYAQWNVGGFSARRRGIIDLLTGDQTGGSHWDEVKASIPNSAVTRTSDTTVTIDLSDIDGVYDNTSDEIITLSDVTADMWKP